jgi:hypothetical protein
VVCNLSVAAAVRSSAETFWDTAASGIYNCAD